MGATIMFSSAFLRSPGRKDKVTQTTPTPPSSSSSYPSVMQFSCQLILGFFSSPSRLNFLHSETTGRVAR